MGFFDAMTDFGGSSREASSVEAYADALSTLAFEIGTQSVMAGDGTEVQAALPNAAAAAAAAADEYRPTGNISTTKWLAVQTTVASVADLCGLPPYNFE
ncbi:hypothetical protein [Salinibacterium sp. ZJ450]|uniref:hypothetical protein n=1 Tax=Salinibacterium sp. ZJ450 TaxID=2708338 RepID=UPI0014200A3F|nr:hypothetical protein [Salinibacterium sp. ZJ450]